MKSLHNRSHSIWEQVGVVTLIYWSNKLYRLTLIFTKTDMLLNLQTLFILHSKKSKYLDKKCKNYLWINAYMHLIQIFYKKRSFAVKNIYFLQKIISYTAIWDVHGQLSSQRITTLHIIKKNLRSAYFIACENNQHLVTQPVVSPRNDVWGMSAENSILITHHCLHLGSASDWLKICSNQT